MSLFLVHNAPIDEVAPSNGTDTFNKGREMVIQCLRQLY